MVPASGVTAVTQNYRTIFEAFLQKISIALPWGQGAMPTFQIGT
jgi:hypothetical protein